jgi:crotonobetainyl-CoA:carnitine CoA-transferase CaiB-like acyl-CoA transferase
LHCNFPHHEEGVTRHLRVPAEREAVAEAVAQRDAFELETELIERGLIAAACRTLEEWSQHPHAEATADLPAVELERIGDGPAIARPAGARPLEGIRVVDCSRVLAGPVGGMTLASHGAEVLRIGAEHLPIVEGGIRSTGFGKRNAYLDLRTADDRATFARLVSEADVMIDAYRPGALAGFGFSAKRLAELRPGIVVVQLCAFDWSGPWGGRRGYDSIVQSTTGISMAGAEVYGSERPVPLPVQVLDYTTGFFAAYTAIRGLHRQLLEGGSWGARVSLLRTRNWLVGLGEGDPHVERPTFEEYLHDVDTEFGRMTAVTAPGGLEGTPPRWDRMPALMGSSEPRWLE